MIRQLFNIYKDTFTCSIENQQNSIKPEKPSHWCCCCHFGLRVKTALLCDKSTLLVPILSFSFFIVVSGYVFYITIMKLIKDDFKKPTSVSFKAFVHLSIYNSNIFLCCSITASVQNV